MGLICPLFYLGAFLVAPIVIAVKAAASEHGLQLRVLFQYLAVYFASVVAAAGVTVMFAFTLPKPNGPPDQAVGQSMALVFAVFPILSLVLGATGSAAMTFRRARSSAKNERRPHTPH